MISKSEIEDEVELKVVLIAADKLRGALETAHLLRSQKNTRRLLTALKRAKKGTGEPY